MKTITQWIAQLLPTATVTLACVGAQAAIGSNAGLAASLTSIDFDNLTSGTVVTNQYSAQGVTFSSSGSVAGPTTIQLLAGMYQGASGMALLPQSAAPGQKSNLFADFQISFDNAIDYFSILALDSDEPLQALGYYQGNLVDSISFTAGSDLQVNQVTLGSIGGNKKFDKIVLNLVEGNPGDVTGGPELYDNLTYHTVPEPTMLGGLFAFGLMGLRKRKLQISQTRF